LKKTNKTRDHIVTITGDLANFKQITRSLDRNSTQLKYGYFAPEFTDYLFVYSSHTFLLTNEFRSIIAKQDPEYSVKFKDANLVNLYKMPYGLVDLPYEFNLQKTGRTTGRLLKVDGVNSVIADSKKHEAGFIFITPGLKLQKGEYEIRVYARVNQVDITKNSFLELKLNNSCNNEKQDRFLVQANNDLLIKSTCLLKEDGKATPSIYWSATYNIELKKLIIAQK
jgi:hypothetical protein